MGFLGTFHVYRAPDGPFDTDRKRQLKYLALSTRDRLFQSIRAGSRDALGFSKLVYCCGNVFRVELAFTLFRCSHG